MAFTDQLPDLGGIDFSSVWVVVTWLVALIIVTLVATVGIYFYMLNKKYTKQIRIFEKIGGKWELTRRDRAMEIYVGTGGETAIYLKNHKKHLPYPNIQTGRNVHWYAIGPDNIWRNIGIGDIDVAMKELKVEYIPTELGLARASLQKLLKDNYQKQKFWDKYGDKVAFAVFLIILGFSLWFTAGRNLEIAKIMGDNLKASTLVVERAEQILASLDNICTGSGLA